MEKTGRRRLTPFLPLYHFWPGVGFMEIRIIIIIIGDEEIKDFTHRSPVNFTETELGERKRPAIGVFLSV